MQVYTPAGRRMLPALKLSAAPVCLSSDGAWQVMAVCRDGSLRVWDLQALTTLLDTSLLPLAAATPTGTAGLHHPVTSHLHASSLPYTSQRHCSTSSSVLGSTLHTVANSGLALAHSALPQQLSSVVESALQKQHQRLLRRNRLLHELMRGEGPPAVPP